ncbi:hypothetical protein BOO69_08170 [Sulfitobacter alexandrii]|uniref:Uncharacterized protein n=1 Tax=Sulfitobacter alexandrii TaxID=1917485 RepID=A0A1J0WMA2_9RHOB|nr:hypothetical protein BOO69_08170 [Sulfitobacter alexandrii]
MTDIFDRDQVAAHVVSHPERFCRVPAVLAAQWAYLKLRRGQPVRFDRLGEPAYLIDRPEASPLAVDLAERSPRISAAVARRKAQFLPPEQWPTP